MLPPGRPSRDHLDFVRPYIAMLPANADIAILGSTPELRDLCVEQDRRHVHVIDRSPSFHRSVASILIYENPIEQVHFGDWFDVLRAMPNSFHAILSDLTLGGIEYKRRAAFFRALHGALRPGGLFLDKVLTHSSALLSLNGLDRKYREAPFNLATVNDFANDYFFLSELAATGVVDIARSHAVLRRRFSGSPRLRRILNEALTLVTPNGVWYYGRPWSSVKRTYARNLVQIGRRDEVKPSVFAGRLRMLAYCRETHRHRTPGGKHLRDNRPTSSRASATS